jgi:hypothetical protein
MNAINQQPMGCFDKEFIKMEMSILKYTEELSGLLPDGWLVARDNECSREMYTPEEKI